LDTPLQGVVTDAMATSPPFGVQAVSESAADPIPEPTAPPYDGSGPKGSEESGSEETSWTTVLAIVLGLALGLGLVIAVWILGSSTLP
jgi:hypothetical protein